ncbi:4Fe-4S dicluster domain-containing protein [Candidatus Aalborgicola defluviihabitans]|uniref:4Fe-4S dicluster domain-containing protein n=1 Tax=Candidatus Aalborgicola defluviihabitans TaxID=3386187 RepID=UPI0039B94CC0
MTSILALGGVTFGLVARVNGERSSNLPVDRIRPPGALREAEFLGACVRCGLCVQACPYDTLHLAELSPLLPTGTPYFTARDTPCHMCETIPCAAACPTGALQLSTINAAAMGLAELSTPERCHSYTGAAYCNSCYQACPLKGPGDPHAAGAHLARGQLQAGGQR